MNTNLLTLPSFYANMINGVLILGALIILFANFTEVKTLSTYQLLVLILLFSITIGIHGVSHFGLETGYGMTPYNFYTKYFK